MYQRYKLIRVYICKKQPVPSLPLNREENDIQWAMLNRKKKSFWYCMTDSIQFCIVSASPSMEWRWFSVVNSIKQRTKLYLINCFTDTGTAYPISCFLERGHHVIGHLGLPGPLEIHACCGFLSSGMQDPSGQSRLLQNL